MSDAMAIDAARALLIAPRAAQPRHRAALAMAGTRLLDAVVPDGADAIFAKLVAADVILLDTTGLAVDQAVAGAARVRDWASGSDCRVVALLDAEALDGAAPALMDIGATLLCAPSPTDYVAALSQATAPRGTRLNDATRERESERLRLLNEEVARLAAVLSDFAADPVRRDVREPGQGFRAEPGGDTPPSARAVRAAIRARRLRDQHFAPELFADPAWDMLLDLYAARLEGVRVSVSSLCIAAAVPPTTALRWINTMHDAGLFEREADPGDRRRAHIILSSRAEAAMRAYFAAAARMGLSPA